MIGRLEGRLHQVRPGQVIVDAGGVGYLVSTTLRAFQELAQTKDCVTLWIHTQVRSEAIALFGFIERAELAAFERLIAVAGVGPRTALAVLSALTPAELREAIESDNVALLQRTPGVGRKTAERILLEVKGKLAGAAASAPDLRGDAISALVNLGYGQREAQRAVAQVLGDGTQDLGDLLRLALQKLTR